MYFDDLTTGVTLSGLNLSGDMQTGIFFEPGTAGNELSDNRICGADEPISPPEACDDNTCEDLNTECN